MKKINKLIIAIVLLVIIIDQTSKIIILNLGEVTIISNVFTLSVKQLETNTSLLTTIVEHVVILAIIIKFIMSQNQFVEIKTKVFLSLVLSGGISNLIDLIIRKNIVNFINIKISNLNLPVLNIAYICIIIGIVLVVGNFAIFTSKEMRNKKDGKIHS